jgi:type II secretory pathway pseudopilin PulG
MRAACRTTGRACGGFTYLGVLLATTLLGLALAGAGTVWSTAARREREAQLLWAGLQFERAIASYYLRGAGGVRQLPRSLEELLEDRRGPAVQRHLRRIYEDPMTGRTDWELLHASDGGIKGVRSRSTKQPLKQRNFPPGHEYLQDASCYCDWLFEFTPPARPLSPVTAP